eukprot:scpid27779/ scgid3366/ Craniofacial development protein 2; p97 bucentaur protein
MRMRTMRKSRKERETLFMASWNVQSLVEDTGDARICRKNKSVSRVDRGLDFLSAELVKFRVGVAGIQETKWFGSDVWPIGNCTFVHSGRPIPTGGEPARRNEGVGIWMNPEMSAAWQRGGEQWDPVSSRIVTARILLHAKGDKLPRGDRCHRDQYLSVINIYAPTNKATFSVKETFYRHLQAIVDKVNRNDIFVLLGDFNARVGSRGTGDFRDRYDDRPPWDQIIGDFGLGQCNQAGEDLLLFCARNSLCVLNTWFRKKLRKRGTWTHPATRQPHLIDYVIMRQDQHVYCQDVSVMRGASFWSDHYMVRARLALSRGAPPRNGRTSGSGNRKRFDVRSLRNTDVCTAFQDSVQERLARDSAVPRESVESIDLEWSGIRDAVTSAASDIIGFGKRVQPDWFLESSSTLEPLIDAKNTCHQALLSNDTVDTRKAFRQAQRTVAKAVRMAKENWISEVVRDAEEAKKDGRTRWKCIRKLQEIEKGRTSKHTSAVLDENGNLIQDADAVRARFGRHFEMVLNTQSQFDQHTVDSMPALDVREHLDDVPSIEELQRALRRMKNGTASGQSGILPELIRCGGEHLLGRLHEFIVRVWETGSVPADWRDAEIVPIPKKGNRHSCDNWRGISLLDVVGKLFARMLQDRLEPLAEDWLPESQCGFRKGRGCIDMIFAARQVLEKAIEHQSDLYVLFVDLRKAYDSVPRTALWLVLQKLGVPPRMLQVIRSLHEGMMASVRVGSGQSDSFGVENGLRQGCTLAPMLFNLYFSAVLAHWRSTSTVPSFPMKHRIGRKLVGDRTAKHRLTDLSVSESLFADDAALYTTSYEHMETMVKEFTQCASGWGLTVSVQKTKFLAVGPSVIRADIVVPGSAGDVIGVVSDFTYLGSTISDDGELDAEVTTRLAKASRAFGRPPPTDFPELGSIAWNPTSHLPGRGPYSAAVWF